MSLVLFSSDNDAAPVASVLPVGYRAELIPVALIADIASLDAPPWYQPSIQARRGSRWIATIVPACLGGCVSEGFA